jgi:protein SCO1
MRARVHGSPLALVPALVLLLGSTLVHASQPVQSGSIFEVGGAFVSHEGKQVELSATRGHKTLITMFYTTCPQACPMLVYQLKKIEQALPEAERSRLRVVLVSLDPERDSPERMAKLAEAHGVDLERWLFLRAPKETVEELAAVLNVRYRFLPDGEINHTSAISLLDEEGRPVGRVEGSNPPIETLIEKLRR